MANATAKSPSSQMDRRKGQKRPKPSDTNDLFTTLARTGLFLEALQKECLAEHGLTFSEFSVLRLLSRAPKRKLAPSTLAEEVICTTGAMTKLVDRLSRTDLVRRTPDPEDRRGVHVEITRKGVALASKAAASYQIGRERVLDRFNSREADRIHDHLSRLLVALEADKDSDAG
jgi:DNA-binding MarR family transcriptional regulator